MNPAAKHSGATPVAHPGRSASGGDFAFVHYSSATTKGTRIGRVTEPKTSLRYKVFTDRPSLPDLNRETRAVDASFIEHEEDQSLPRVFFCGGAGVLIDI